MSETTKDVAVRGDVSTGLVVPSADAGMYDQLQTWMRSASIAQQLAAVMCAGPFAPRGFRGNTEATATAILAGMELGFSPSRALRSFHVVEGNATLAAESMRALIAAKGHEIKVIRGTDGATVRARRKGTEEWLETSFTIEDAITAELVSRGAGGKLTGKDNWRKYPITMCANRATTQMAKDNFADVIGGMDGMEEMQDADPASIRVDVVEERAPARTAAAVLAAAVPDHVAVLAADDARLAAESAEVDAQHAAERQQRSEPAATVAGPAETGEAISERTVGFVNELFVRGGVTGLGQTEKRRRVVEHIVQRDVSRIRDLTEAEGLRVVAQLHERGRDLIAAVLAEPGPQSAPEVEQPQADVEPAAEVRDDVTADEIADAFPGAGGYDVAEPPAEPEGWQQ